MKSCLAAIRETKAVKALAHITGGGFPDNIPRVLPKNLGARIDLARIPVLPVFQWLAETGGIAEKEMLRTFNCGIGMIAVVEPRAADKVAAVLKREGETRRAARRARRRGQRQAARDLHRPPRHLAPGCRAWPASASPS